MFEASSPWATSTDRAPAALGRGLVVAADGDAPGAWSGAPEIVVDDDALRAPRPVVDELHDAWSRRRPVVVRVAVDPVLFRRPQTTDVAPWEIGPEFTFDLDRLHFLVWNNNYDGRDPSGPPVWWWARKAVRLGAEATEDGRGDVVLADGTPAWIDGGPPDDVDPAGFDGGMIRAEAVEFGHLDLVPAWVPPSADLAPDQLAAVAHRGGAARVIAPAGSGKTRVLTERLRHMIADRGHDPAGVVAVAYNRKAADEMAERTTDLGSVGPGEPRRVTNAPPSSSSGGSARAPRIQTLNAMGYGLVGRYHGRRPRLLDEREVRNRLEPNLPRLTRRLNTDPMAPYLDGLSMIRLGLVDPEVAEATADAPGLAEAVEPYRERLRRDGVLDFDEQITYAVELLLRDGEFRRAEQARHRHLLVDEFQDLTPAHVLLIRLLATPAFDVFGVGDDDQTIYGHAGASPRFLIDFAEHFPGAAEHALEVNYRCPPSVVDAARNVLAYNDVRVDKTIRAARTDDGPLRVRQHPAQEGATTLVGVVSDLLADNQPADVAVLTRTNSLLLAPHVALVDAGVPVSSVLRPTVLDRVGLRAALAWLRIASDPGAVAGADLIEVSRRPSRGFPRWIDKWLGRCRSGHEVKRAAERIDDARVADKMLDLADDIERLGEMADGASTRDVLAFIRDEIGLGGAMELLDGRPGAEGSSHIDDLDALIQVADIQPDPDLFETYLRRALLPDPDGSDGSVAPQGRPGAAGAGVTLSTIHRVKGREWPHVVIFGANGGLIPHRLADDVEEERRVFHVGFTRGISSVTVLADAERPSEFLGELDGSAPKMAKRRRPAAGNLLAPARTLSTSDDELAGEDKVLFGQLREWRAAVAKRQGGPAFTVFNDATLRSIARTRPTDLRSLSKVKGIGPTKLENYGDDVLEIVARFA